MIAIKQATEIRQAGIYMLAVVDGQEVDLTAALEQAGALLLTADARKGLAAAIREYNELLHFYQDDDDAPSGRHLDDFMKLCKQWAS